MNVRYHALRCQAASRQPGMPADTLVCIVQIELPDGGITAMIVPEDDILEHAHGDIGKEEAYIQHKVKQVVSSMLAGAVGDMNLVPQ